MDKDDIITLGSSDEDEPKKKTETFPVIINAMSLRKPITELIKRKLNDIKQKSIECKRLKTSETTSKESTAHNISDKEKHKKDITISPIKCINTAKVNNNKEVTKKSKYSNTIKSLSRSILHDTVIDITDDEPDDPNPVVISSKSPEKQPKVVLERISTLVGDESSKNSARSILKLNYQDTPNTSHEYSGLKSKTILSRVNSGKPFVSMKENGRTEIQDSNLKSLPELNLNPVKDMQVATTTVTLTESTSLATNNETERLPSPQSQSEKSTVTELDPIFKEFLNTLREADRDEKTEIIINNKLIKYYKDMDSEYAKSEEFCTLVKEKAKSIENNPKICFSYVNDILEYMKRNRPENLRYANKKQVRRLKEALRQCVKKIKELEDADLDFESEENSTYIQLDLYHRRTVKIHKKICELTNQNSDAGRAINWKIVYPVGKYPVVDKAVQNFVYKSKRFPDFHDILKCVKKCNLKYSLKLSNDYIEVLAREAFTKVGKELQRRRQIDYYDSVSTMLGTSVDPASADSELKNKLEQNKKEYSHKEQEIINKYVNLATELKLVPEEVNEHEDEEEKSEDDDNELTSNNESE